jgi:hypothetical protein
LWGDDYFLAGFTVACVLAALGVYVLVAEFIGGIGPLKFPLPPTRHEREPKMQASRPARVYVPKGRIPLRTAPPTQVSEEEARRIAASSDPRFAGYRAFPAQKRNVQQETKRLVALYREGEQLRASILLSASSIVGDLIRGTANQRQVERERLARDWDGRVHDALAEPCWV